MKLYATKAFCHKAYKVDADVSVTVDFLFSHKICAIATKGLDGFFVDEYQISYGVEYDVWNTTSLFGSPYVSRYIILLRSSHTQDPTSQLHIYL